MNAAAIRARSTISAPWTGRIYACRRALGGCHVQITLAHSGWSIYATEPPGDRGTRLAMGSLLRECAHRGQHRRHNGSVTERLLSSHGSTYVHRATPYCARRDDHTRPTVPPLLCLRPACIGVQGQKCTATFLLRFPAQLLLQGPGDGGKVHQLLSGRSKPGCLTRGCCEQGSWYKTSAAPPLCAERTLP